MDGVASLIAARDWADSPTGPPTAWSATLRTTSDMLRDRGLPFIFAAGYGAQGLDPAYRDRPVLQKPFVLEDMAQAIALAARG